MPHCWNMPELWTSLRKAGFGCVTTLGIAGLCGDLLHAESPLAPNTSEQSTPAKPKGKSKAKAKSKAARTRVEWPAQTNSVSVSVPGSSSSNAAAPGAPALFIPPGSAPPGAPQPAAMPGEITISSQPGTICSIGQDYWIVSSRSCKKQDREQGNTCCLNYFHSPHDKQMMPTERASLFAALNPQIPVCFVIHGSYNRWSDVVAESRNIHRWIRAGSQGTPLQVVFFTWPSDGNMPFLFPVDIAVLGRRCSLHAVYLAQLISDVPPEVRVSLVGHSHGSRVAVSALHLLGGGRIENGQALPGPVVPHRIRATIIASAVDHYWLNPGERYGQALCAVERMLIVHNSRDTTMALYPLRKPFGEPSLGGPGLSPLDRMMIDGNNAKIAQMDAAGFVNHRHAWASYYRHPALSEAIAPYVYYQEEGLPFPGTFDPSLATPGGFVSPPPGSPNLPTGQSFPAPPQPAPKTYAPNSSLYGPRNAAPSPHVSVDPQSNVLPLKSPSGVPGHQPLPVTPSFPKDDAFLPQRPASTAHTGQPDFSPLKIEPTYIQPLPRKTTQNALPEDPILRVPGTAHSQTSRSGGTLSPIQLDWDERQGFRPAAHPLNRR